MKRLTWTQTIVAALTVLAAMVLLHMSLPVPNYAQEPLPPSAALIEESYERGEIDYETALLYKVYSLFDPEKLPAEYQSDTSIPCGTPILLEVKRNWDRLSPEVKSALSVYPMQGRPTLSGPELTYDTAHFQIHYTTSGADAIAPANDDNGNGTPDCIEAIGTAFENVWNAEINTLGWLQPPSDQSSDGDPDVDVYIYDIGFSGGFASFESSTGDNENSPTVIERFAGYGWIAFTNGWTIWGSCTESSFMPLAAHEFNHLVQFGYNYWGAGWFMEATANWMQGEVFEVLGADWWASPYVYFSSPDTCMPHQDHGYADWIFLRYISEHHDQSTVRSIWEHIVHYASNMAGIFQAISDALGAAGTSLVDVFENFTAANRVLSTCPTNTPYCYEKAVAYPDVYIEGNINFNGTTTTYNPPDGIGQYSADYVAINSTVDAMKVSVAGSGPSNNYGAQIVSLGDGVATVTPFFMTSGTAGWAIVSGTVPYSLTLVIKNEDNWEDEWGRADCADSGYTVSVDPASFLPTKVDNPDPVQPGGLLTYTLTIANVTTGGFTGLVITDTVPAKTSFVWASEGGTLVAGNVVSWTAPSLAGWASITRTLVVSVSSAARSQVITNTTYGVRCDQVPTPTWGATVATTVEGAVYLPVIRRE